MAAKTVGFCSRCGGDVDEGERSCACCGADTIDANLVTLLKRTSSRRSQRGREEDPVDDTRFPL